MKIYVDVIFFLNFSFDFLLLITVKLLLKINIKFYRVLIASFIGALSTFLLFVPISSFTLFLFKIIVSILMILISFGKKNFLKNIGYLYFTSIVLGGFLTFINNQFSYKQEGLIFFFEGFSVPTLVLLIMSPIILFCYYKQTHYFKYKLSNIHQVELILKDKHYYYRAYFDTGNVLVDPYHNRDVHLLYDPKLFSKFTNFIIIPFKALNFSGIVRGIIFDTMIIDKTIIIEKPLIGFSKEPFHLDSNDMILHANLKDKL